MRTTILASALLLAAASAGRCARGGFSAGPRAAKTENGARITFTVSEPTDVEVAVLDARGRIVRHLAAGVLGAKAPPPPPLKAGLSQSIAWDGKDDLGEKVAGGMVRVRIGMAVRFGRLIGASPCVGTVVSMPYSSPVNGLAVDDEGQLYVKMMASVGSHGNSGLWPWHLRRFDRNGKYVRTILPYPPSTPPAKAPAFRLLKAGEETLTPANRTSLYPVLYEMGNEICSRLVNGSVVFVNSRAGKLHFLSLDGSGKLTTVRMWPKKSGLKCARWLEIQVAISPDGKFAYYSNVADAAYDCKKPSDINPKWPQGRIYRQEISKPDSKPEAFYDLELPDFAKRKYWLPNAWNARTAAAGIATDAKGNLLICDQVNQEIVELSPEGKRLSATRLPSPDRIMVSRKTGAMYVISRKVARYLNQERAVLLKVTGRGEEARIVAKLPLRGTIGGSYTLDESGKTPVLWLAGTPQPRTARFRDKLLRVEDRGSELKITGDSFLNGDPDAISFVAYMDVDPEAELVYVTNSDGAVWRFNGETGEGGGIKIKTADLAVGPGGHVYAWGIAGKSFGPVARFTRELKPAPLPGLGKHTYGNVHGSHGRGSRLCGMDVDRNGRVYAACGVNICHVKAYEPDGNPVQFPRKITLVSRKTKAKREIPVAVDYLTGYGGGLRVDAGGNIYVLQYGRPKGHKPPKGYEKDPAYAGSVGTILKFGPQGGRRKTPLLKNDLSMWRSDPHAYDGLLARYPGCGPLSRWRAAGACLCTKPRFDVDGFGRLYIPNAITFKVSVRDNANNEIVRFGAYGNFDAQGPESAEPKPPIPLGWPVAAGASDKYVYVGDCLNHRVVRVDKTWAAARTCPIR